MDIEIEAGLRAKIRKCNAVLGKNPNSDHHKKLLKEAQKELDKLHGTKSAKKTKATKEEPEATATVSETPLPEPTEENTSASI